MYRAVQHTLKNLGIPRQGPAQASLVRRGRRTASPAHRTEYVGSFELSAIASVELQPCGPSERNVPKFPKKCHSTASIGTVSACRAVVTSLDGMAKRRGCFFDEKRRKESRAQNRGRFLTQQRPRRLPARTTFAGICKYLQSLQLKLNQSCASFDIHRITSLSIVWQQFYAQETWCLHQIECSVCSSTPLRCCAHASNVCLS